MLNLFFTSTFLDLVAVEKIIRLMVLQFLLLTLTRCPLYCSRLVILEAVAAGSEGSSDMVILLLSSRLAARLAASSASFFALLSFLLACTKDFQSNT